MFASEFVLLGFIQIVVKVRQKLRVAGMTTALDFSFLAKVKRKRKQQKGHIRTLFVLDSSRGGDGIR